VLFYSFIFGCPRGKTVSLRTYLVWQIPYVAGYVFFLILANKLLLTYTSEEGCLLSNSTTLASLLGPDNLNPGICLDAVKEMFFNKNMDI
jgi:hypothetical protein